MKLTNIETIAVGIAIKEAALKDLKRGLTPGVHNVDVTVRILGSINRLADTTGVIAQKAEPWALLAAALDKLNGVTVESLVAEAEKLRSDEAKMEAIKERTAAALVAIKGKVTGPISGQTRGTLTVELVATERSAADAVAEIATTV